jgi:hypothetical protein
MAPGMSRNRYGNGWPVRALIAQRVKAGGSFSGNRFRLRRHRKGHRLFSPRGFRDATGGATMADRGKRLDQCLRDRIKRLAPYTPIKQIARIVGVDRNTVRKYARAICSFTPTRNNL